MNLQAEKLKLIEWLAGLTDQTLIERIKLLKETQSTKVDWWEELSQTERDAIDQGLEDAERGKVTNHEEVRKRYEKWL
jgi:hypothetical protein